MKACLGTMEATTKAGQAQMKAKIKTCLEKMETIQEKIEAIAQHYEEVPRAEAMNLLTAQQDQASDLLHRNPKKAMVRADYQNT
jgi:archaellum component FlaC